MYQRLVQKQAMFQFNSVDGDRAERIDHSFRGSTGDSGRWSWWSLGSPRQVRADNRGLTEPVLEH
jgi:hypothetical protein